jgi:glutamyl-tRNA synthetase
MVRVRFAPSPTGDLHLGGARTALYNFLFAQKNKGKFILRIEDTDRTRSTEEAIESIEEDLRWLGLFWDEGPDVGGDYGPYRQTERKEIYQRFVERLLQEGKAYYCFCTPEELQREREEAKRKGISFRYSRRCRNLSLSQIEEERRRNPHPAVRFATPLGGATIVKDIIRGSIRFEHSEMDDFIILRSDGTPTYNLAATIDDALMKITHVIRGDDHLSNTPKQILIYRSLGFDIPQFAHLPMILGPDKKPLSKRHGDTAIWQYRKKGYLPQALVNYLALLGWSYDDKTTLFTMDELKEKFSLEKVSKNAAVFDIPKLNWMNGYYIRQLADDELASLLLPYIQNRFPGKKVNIELVRKIVPMVRERINLLNEVVEWVDFIFMEEVDFDSESWEKIMKKDGVPEILAKAYKTLEGISRFEASRIEEELKDLAEKLRVKKKQLFQPIRVAVTGRRVSPPLYESLEILGRERTLQRIEKALSLLKKNPI